MRKAVTISPVRQNHISLTVRKAGLNVIGKGNRLVLNKHLSGIKKARCLFEPITGGSPDHLSDTWI